MMAENRNGTEHKCAFCRQLTVTPEEDAKHYIKQLKKLEKNHPNGFIQLAIRYKSGDGVIQSDTKSLEMCIRAAELGFAPAFAMIGNVYAEGDLVPRDVSKTLEYHEIAAKKGSIPSRINLALFHERNSDIYNSIKHLKVTACTGHQESMDKLMQHYRNKSLSKEDLAQTLRAHQASSDLMKSKARDDAQSKIDSFFHG